MSRRVERVADAIRAAVAEILLREVKDPRVGMVTITDVKLSNDLRHARVFFSVFGGEEQREASLAGLQRAAGFIRRQLARHVELRVSPEISFAFDPGLEQAERLARLLKKDAGEES
ncbi:MAG TPA: 30S ribosome-binding factor RbfA [Candidatus Binatia bacterium]|nr:30S ribosome-binding factor RbfA [Candidatus Binatia bacterium]